MAFNQLVYVLTIGLLILPLIWFITDPRSFKERLFYYFRFKAIFLAICEFVFVGVNLLFLEFLQWPTSRFDETFLFFGIGFYVFGLIFSIWAKITMRQNWGVPGEHDVNRQTKLVIKGPFSISRNPIYVGLTMTFLGYFMGVRSYLIIVAFVIGIFFYISAIKEEVLLERVFGQQYVKYKKKVPRFLLIKTS